MNLIISHDFFEFYAQLIAQCFNFVIEDEWVTVQDVPVTEHQAYLYEMCENTPESILEEYFDEFG